MKKLAALLLACALLLTFAAAEVLDFGDFTLDLDPDMPGSIFEKENNALYLMFFPGYEEEATFHQNVTVVWMEAETPITDEYAQALAAESLRDLAVGSADYGMLITDADISGISISELGGNEGIFLTISYNVDYSPSGIDLQYTSYGLQAFFSPAGKGTYVFNATSNSMKGLQTLTEILDTLQWIN